MADERVPVVSPDGTPGTLPKEQVPELESSGGRVMSPAEAAQTERRIAIDEKYDPMRHPGDAYVEMTGANMAGLYRGLTGGLSDVAISKIGGEDARAKLSEMRAVHPYSGGLMEAAGTIGAIAAGNEIAPLARGGSALARIASHAARGSAEMGLYETAKTAGEAALADEPITGEKLVAGFGHGALFGAIAGGAFGGIGEAFAGAGRGARAVARTGELGEAPAARSGSMLERAADALGEKADQHTMKALGATNAQAQAIERSVPGGVERVANDVRTFVKESTGKTMLSREEIAHAVEDGVEKLTDKKFAMLRALDESGTGIAPDAGRFIRAVEKDVIAPHMVKVAGGELVPAPFAEKVVNEAQDAIMQIDRAFGGKPATFEAWDKARRMLDKGINFAKRNASPTEEALKDVRKLMEAELDKAGDAAAAQSGGSFSAEYRANQQVLQSLIKAKEITARGVAANTVNNAFGLTSRIAGIVGGAAGGIPGAAAGLAVGKVTQSYGDVLAAELFERASGILGARRVAARAEARMIRGVQDLVGKAANDNAIPYAKASFAPPVRAALTPVGVKLTGNKRKDYAAISERLTSSAANPAALTDRLGRALGDLPQHSPKAADSVIQTTLRGAEFLRSKLPPARQDQYTLQPQLQKGSRASDAEISRFMRYADAVDDPMIVFREARTGTLTRDHVEAVKAVYPKLYEEMQQQVMRSLIESKSELPYQRRIQLGILLDIPTDKTLSPDFMRAVQATFESADKAGAETPHPTPTPNVHDAKAAQTATQAAASNAA